MTIEFKDVVVGDIFYDSDNDIYWRKISTSEVVQLSGISRIADHSDFSEGLGELFDCFSDDDEFDTVPDDKKRELLAAHKRFLEDLANLFGVIL